MLSTGSMLLRYRAPLGAIAKYYHATSRIFKNYSNSKQFHKKFLDVSVVFQSSLNTNLRLLSTRLPWLYMDMDRCKRQMQQAPLRRYHMPESDVKISQRPSYEQLVERVLKVIKAHDRLKPEQVSLNSHFMRDLGLDSFDQVEIMLAIEEEFGFDQAIPDEEAEKPMTAQEIIDYLSQRLQVRKPNASGSGHAH